MRERQQLELEHDCRSGRADTDKLGIGNDVGRGHHDRHHDQDRERLERDLLVGPNGRALYLWVADSGDMSSCSGACAQAWPPL